MSILIGLLIALVLLIVVILAFAMVRCGGYDGLSFTFLGLLGGMALMIFVGILVV